MIHLNSQNNFYRSELQLIHFANENLLWEENLMESLNYSRFALMAFLLVICFCSTNQKKQSVDYVDPFICTQGDHGHQHPGATVPWGMVILGPDTYPSSLTGNGNWAHSGYNYADSYVRGFSHIRIVGSGGTRSYDREKIITMLPLIGKPETDPEKRYYHIDKKSETAAPGYYSIIMDSMDIKVELSVTRHSGFHKYTFAKSDEAHILFKLGNKGRDSGAFLEVINEKEICGYNSKRLYFYLQLDTPAECISTWNEDKVIEKGIAEGGHIGAFIDFETDERQIIKAKIGFSTTSIEDAKNNLKNEIPDWDFDSCVNKAKQLWADRLNVVKLEGNEEYKEIFYTHLYQSYITPCNITNSDGQYTGSDGKVHEADGFSFYANFLFWDEYRTKYSLLSLTQPDVYKDVIRSLLDMYERGFSVSPFLAFNHQHLVAIIADAQAKGFIDYNFEKAYPNMVDYINLKHFRRKGYTKNNLAELRNKFHKIGYIPTRPDYTLE